MRRWAIILLAATALAGCVQPHAVQIPTEAQVGGQDNTVAQSQGDTTSDTRGRNALSFNGPINLNIDGGAIVGLAWAAVAIVVAVVIGSLMVKLLLAKMSWPAKRGGAGQHNA